GGVGHRESNRVALLLMAVRPVGEGGGDERLVGNDDVLAVERLERGAAHVELADPPRSAVLQLDVVVERDGAIEQDNDSGHEVGGEVLEPEARPQGERPPEDGERGELDPATCSRRTNRMMKRTTSNSFAITSRVPTSSCGWLRMTRLPVEAEIRPS